MRGRKANVPSLRVNLRQNLARYWYPAVAPCCAAAGLQSINTNRQPSPRRQQHFGIWVKVSHRGGVPLCRGRSARLCAAALRCLLRVPLSDCETCGAVRLLLGILLPDRAHTHSRAAKVTAIQGNRLRRKAYWAEKQRWNSPKILGEESSQSRCRRVQASSNSGPSESSDMTKNRQEACRPCKVLQKQYYTSGSRAPAGALTLSFLGFGLRPHSCSCFHKAMLESSFI